MREGVEASLEKQIFFVRILHTGKLIPRDVSYLPM